YVVARVDEVEDVGCVLAGVRPVQTRKRLHCLDARKAAVDVHAAEQRLVEPGLKLVGDEEDEELGKLEGLADVTSCKRGVQLLALLREGFLTTGRVVHFSRKCHQSTEVIPLLLDVLLDRQLPANCLNAAADHHHRLRSSI